ncbi:MAG: hypothetical protein ACREMF_10340, partial [Gemmatimonadales bacterium]
MVRYHLARWLWVAGLAVLAMVVFPSATTNLAPLLEIGGRADRHVVAPFDFVVGKSAEELRREADEVAASARPIYELRSRAYDSVRVAARRLFEAVAAAAVDGAPAVGRVAAEAGIPLTPAEAGYLSQTDKRQAQERALDTLFQGTLALGVLSSAAFERETVPQLIVRRGASEIPLARDQVLTFNAYVQRALAVHPDPGSSVGDVVYLKLVRWCFRPTLVRNDVETARRRSELAAGVDKSKYAVRQGDVIVEANEIVTGPAEEKLTALHAELVRRGAATSRSPGGIIGPFLRNFLILSIFWVLMLFYRRETYGHLRQVGTVAALFACAILAGGAVARMAPGRAELILLPFTAMMLTVLFNGRVSMIAAMILAVLIAVQPVFH